MQAGEDNETGRYISHFCSHVLGRWAGAGVKIVNIQLVLNELKNKMTSLRVLKAYPAPFLSISQRIKNVILTTTLR